MENKKAIRDHIFRNQYSSTHVKKDVFLSFIQRFGGRFILVQTQNSRPLGCSKFKYHLFQDRSGVAFYNRVKTSAMELSFELQQSELEGNFIFLLFIHQGRCEIKTEEESKLLKPDSFMILRAESAVFLKTDNALEWSLFVFPGNYFATHSGVLLRVMFGVPFFADKYITRLFAKTFRITVSTIPKLSSDETDDVTDGLCVFLRAVLTQYSNTVGQDNSDKITVYRERALALMNSSSGDPSLGLEKMAEQLGISSRYLSEIFRISGTTAMHQLKAIRLRKATTMLSEQHMKSKSIRQISENCGYRSQAHFSRDFKDFYGLCPSEYRSRNVLERKPL